MIAPANRFIVRAELRRGSDIQISYAFELAPDAAFVATEWSAEIGERIELRLSFPGVLEPIVLDASVAEQRAASGPGAPAGLRLQFSPDPRLSAVIARANDAATPTHVCRILLVEDNGFIRDVFEYSLHAFARSKGAYAIDQAESVDDAWVRLARAPYDIAIVDYYLATETGATLIARMRGDTRFAAIPVVAVSVGGDDARSASLEAGADLFLDKPLALRDLFTTLQLLARAPRKKRILVFDDSPIVLEIARAALESAGFAVAVAEDLATFEQRRGTVDPDLILVDVELPDTFGDEVARTLRETHGVHVPILLVSGLEESELARRAAHARIAGYVPKTAGMGELVRRCKEVLETPS